MAYNIGIRFRDWLQTSNGRAVLILAVIVGLGFVVSFLSRFDKNPNTETVSGSALTSSSSSSADDESAKREIKKLAWVKDVYVSPGHMNVGVIRTEKQWNSLMIGNSICGILRKTRSSLTRVRFVDIEEVAYEQKSAQAAEIYVFSCS